MMEPLKTSWMEEVPVGPPEPGEIILGYWTDQVGERRPWAVRFACPCGCGEEYHLPVTEDPADKRSGWWLLVSRDPVTLRPSVHRQVGCKSHFFVKDGHFVMA